MATVTTVVLVVGALATVLAVFFVLLVVVQRVTRAYHDAIRSIERLRPALDELAEHQEVSRRELDRLAATRAGDRGR